MPISVFDTLAQDTSIGTDGTSPPAFPGGSSGVRGWLRAILAAVVNIPAQGQALSAASLPVVLPAAQVTTLTPPAAITGFSTAAKQAALGTAGTPSADVLTVQGSASGTPLPVVASVPTAANILAGRSPTDGATIITIPANRVWAGWVSLNASLAVAASGAAVSTGASVSIAGATAAPTAGLILAVEVAVPLQLSTTTAQVASSDRTYLVIAAGTGAATLTLQKNNCTSVSATASGVLIA